MACSKYTLTNTGSTIVNFNYQRCDDAMWEYQVELAPNQTKNIWLLDTTYSTAFSTSIVKVDLGVFPPPKVTPTPTQTPTNTSSPTPTPSVTPTHTQTPTPTNVLRTTQSVGCHDEASAQGACNCDQGATVFTNGADFASSTLAWSDEFGANTGNPEGFYVEDGIVYQVSSSCGIGCITGATITVVGPCGATPTPTSSQTPTPTVTPTVTPTDTPQVSPTTTSTPTNTPTLTQTPTNTASVTPTLTQTPTPSSFGSNTFKVTMSNSSRALINGYTLTEVPYISTSGIGFSATTGTFPLSATSSSSSSVYGTHAALNSSTVSFEINSTGSASISILWYVNGSVVSTLNSSVVNGPNTLNLFVAGPYSTSDTVEFRIS